MIEPSAITIIRLLLGFLDNSVREIVGRVIERCRGQELSTKSCRVKRIVPTLSREWRLSTVLESVLESAQVKNV